MAEWHYVLKGAATKRMGAQPTPRAVRCFFIYNLLFILILLLTKFIVCRPPPPPDTSYDPPLPPHTYTLTLPADYHCDKKNYLIDVSTSVVPL